MEGTRSIDGLEGPSSKARNADFNCIVPSHDCVDNTFGISSSAMEDNIVSDSSMTMDPEISLPRLKYGYRTKPLQWDELIEIICKQKDLAKMSRSQQQQYEYELYKRKTLLQWKSMTDFVLCTKFPNVFTKKSVDDDSENGPRFVADPPIERLPPGRTYTALVKNDFPYYMAEGIEHWILWKLGPDCSITDQDIQQAKEQLSDHLQSEGVGMIHWINPAHLKSIPLIEHAHILGQVKGHAEALDRL